MDRRTGAATTLVMRLLGACLAGLLGLGAGATATAAGSSPGTIRPQEASQPSSAHGPQQTGQTSATSALGKPVVPGPAQQPAQEPGQPQNSATLRVGLTQQIDSLNPFLGFSQAATDLFRSIYPTLTAYSQQDFSPVPELAENWQVSEDKLTWTFRIRPGVTWSDGRPVTAEDAAFTYNRMLTDPAARTANGNLVENFAEVTATDPSTLRIRTKSPQTTLLALDVPIVPKHVWEPVRDIANFANDAMPVVGSGPFVLTEYEPEQYARLQANPRFWRGAPKVGQLQFVSFKNSDAAVQALRKGDVDVVQKLTPAQFESLKDQPGITRVQGQGRRFSEIVVNPGATNSQNQPIGTGHPALKDVRVRQALDQAIDRNALVTRVLGGHGEVGAGYLPPIFDRFTWQPASGQARQFDPAAANRALDAAGYARGPDGIRRGPGPQGPPLELDFLLHGDEAGDAQLGEFVKQWLGDLGIRVRLETVSDNQLKERTTAGDFDLVVSGWSVNPDPDYVLSLQTCGARPSSDGGGNPDSFLCDRAYDELYREQLAAFDPAQRAEVVKRAQQRFYEQAAGLVLYYPHSLEAYRSDRFSSLPMQPANKGVVTAQLGYWGYAGAQPTRAAMETGQSNHGTVLVGLGAVVLIVAAGIVVLVLRRRASADQRE